MSLSHSGSDLVFKKRSVVGRKSLTVFEKGARQLQGPDKKRLSRIKAKGAGSAKPSASPRFVKDPKTGVLRSGV